MPKSVLFSAREKEVIAPLLEGKSNKQIALELGIAQRTVEFHLSNIYTKLGVISRTEAALKLADIYLRESTVGNCGSPQWTEWMNPTTMSIHPFQHKGVP